MIDRNLENYLTRLEKALAPIGVSERAEIITEIKSHVHEALSRGDQSVDQILSALGEPEQVANKYLMERGLKPQKLPKHPILKWLTIGFLGTVGIICLFILILVWNFTPVIKVDDKGVKILGGLIDIKGDEMMKKNIKIGKVVDDDSEQVSGQEIIDEKKINKIEIKFSNGQIDLKNSSGKEFSWDCEVKGDQVQILPKMVGSTFTLDMSAADGVDCDLRIPEKSNLNIKGANGELSFQEPKFHVDAGLVNGNIQFDPDKSTDYQYSLDVSRGSKDQFVSSTKASAFKIHAKVENGQIEKL